MLSLQEIKSKKDDIDIMMNNVIRGDKILCPKCKQGILHHKGGCFFYCDFNECKFKITIDKTRN